MVAVPPTKIWAANIEELGQQLGRKTGREVHASGSQILVASARDVRSELAGASAQYYDLRPSKEIIAQELLEGAFLTLPLSTHRESAPGWEGALTAPPSPELSLCEAFLPRQIHR